MVDIYEKVRVRSQICEKFNSRFKNDLKGFIDIVESPIWDFMFDDEHNFLYVKFVDLASKLRYMSASHSDKTPLDLIWWALPSILLIV